MNAMNNVRLMHISKFKARYLLCLAVFFGCMTYNVVRADSVNSSNITLNVDINRAAATGAGAGDISVAVNAITIAETSVNEYSAGAGKKISLQVRPGYQFDPSSPITAQSTSFEFNGGGGGDPVAPITPTGAADEIIVFNLTDGGTAGQDIIRINGVKLRILSAAGAAGPAQTTMSLTTTAAGGAFADQGIVAASITKGAPDHLAFSIQPGSNEAGIDLLPSVKIVDFGDNVITTSERTVTLAIQEDPGSATLLGEIAHLTASGVATWLDTDDLNITTAGVGYTLRASHNGDDFLTSDTVDSEPFDITAGPPGILLITRQPIDTVAGEDILIDVAAVDQFSNPILTGLSVTLDSAINPGGWPLLSENGLTKTTVNGIATWDSTDHLRINSKITGYRLAVSGLGSPLETDAFDISAAAPSSLRFVQQPTTTVEDVIFDPPVSVEIIDEFGNRTDSNAQVKLSLINAPCGGNVSGGAATANDGLARFAVLAVDKACDNDQLTASSDGLPSVDSEPFSVACGACGSGAAVMMAPMLLIQMVWRRRMTRKMSRRCIK